MRTRFSLIGLCSLVVLASCGGGGGGSNPPTNSLPPTAPTSVTASGVDFGIEVRWTESNNATQYNVYWRDSPGVNPQNGNKVIITASPVIIPGLVFGTFYYTVVTAENAFGESVASSEVTTQPRFSLPSRVQGVRFLPGDRQVTVSWDQATDAEDYSISWNSSIGNGTLDQIASSPYVVDGLTNGVTYSMYVAANNSLGRGNWSQTVEVTPVAPVPGWTPQTQINDPPTGFSGNAFIYDSAINDNGIAAVLWRSTEGTNGSVKRLVLNHNVGGTWGEQIILDDGDGWGAVAITPNDDIHVVSASDASNVRARRLRNGVLSAPVTIHGPDPKYQRTLVRLAADGQGNVFAAWAEAELAPGSTTSRAATYQVWARRFDSNTDSWGDAAMVGDSVGLVLEISIDAADSDRAIIAWLQDTVPWDPDSPAGPKRRVVYASLYDGSIWQSGTIVGQDDLIDFDNGEEVTLDVNSAGTAVIAWTHTLSLNGTADSYHIGAVRYDAQIGQWSAPETVLDGNVRTHSPDVGIDAANQSTVAWGTGNNESVSSSNYDTNSALWEPETQVPTDANNSFDRFEIEKNEAGETVLVWVREFQEPQGLFVGRLAPGSVIWGDSDHLGGFAGNSMKFKMSGNGHAIIAVKDTNGYNVDAQHVVMVSIYSP